MNKIKRRKKINNIQNILKKIQPTTLIAVTKYATDEQTQQVINEGIINLGESKIQDLARKKELFNSPKLTWHFIGHLQTNKAKKAVQLADCIQSVDSLRLLDILNKECEIINKKLPILLQVNIAKEPSKHGFTEEEIRSNQDQFFSFAFLTIKGIMMIAPNIEDETLIKKYFIKTKELYDELKIKYHSIDTLSMGMSSDYALAIQTGATMIRLGSILYNK